MKKTISIIALILVVISCRVSYQFNGASIDYSKIKTIEIRDFPNQAARVYPLLTQVFNEEVKDYFTRNTKLQIVNNQKSDLELEGEIVGYELTPMSTQADGYASQTRLTMTVRIRFRNNVNPNEDKEESISAYRDFDSSRMFDTVQDELIAELTKEIVDQIFNTTMANW